LRASDIHNTEAVEMFDADGGITEGKGGGTLELQADGATVLENQSRKLQAKCEIQRKSNVAPESETILKCER
jgi:hypothetical protein